MRPFSGEPIVRRYVQETERYYLVNFPANYELWRDSITTLLIEAIEHMDKDVILDFGNIKKADTSSIASFIRLLKMLKGRKFYACGISESLRALMDITMTEPIFRNNVKGYDVLEDILRENYGETRSK